MDTRIAYLLRLSPYGRQHLKQQNSIKYFKDLSFQGKVLGNRGVQYKLRGVINLARNRFKKKESARQQRAPQSI